MIAHGCAIIWNHDIFSHKVWHFCYLTIDNILILCAGLWTIRLIMTANLWWWSQALIDRGHVELDLRSQDGPKGFYHLGQDSGVGYCGCTSGQRYLTCSVSNSILTCTKESQYSSLMASLLILWWGSLREVCTFMTLDGCSDIATK